MAKKAEHFEIAEKLYVYEHMTIEAVASRLPVSERTLRYWRDEGDWDRKRCEYIFERKSFHAEMFDLSKLMAEKLRNKLNADEDIKPGDIYGFANMVKLLDKIKSYENSVEIEEKQQSDSPQFDTNDLVDLMRKEVLGL